MSVLDEISAAPSASAMNAALRQGIERVSGDQTVTFTKYVRKILPIDGFAFWVRASLLGDMTPDLTVNGSLHLASDKQQTAEAVWSRVAVTFTSEQDVSQGFDALGSVGEVLIATATGQSLGETVASGALGTVAAPVRLAFSRLGFYQNAGVFHYSGTAIYPYMLSQIVDDLSVLPAAQIVANSLPAWLALNDYVVGAPGGPFYGFGNQIPLYPAMLSTANISPPYATVDVKPEDTVALASVPFLRRNSTHGQLARDRVKVTFYGVDNDDAATFLDCALQYMQDYQVLGLLNCPVIREEHEGQAELSILAQKKSITFEVSYFQASVRNIARQMIATALTSVRELDSVASSTNVLLDVT